MAKRLLLSLFLAIIVIALSISAVTAESLDNQSKDKTIIINRTDFPALYLASPNIAGEAIWMLQARLKELGYEVECNGKYNNETCKNVRLFQIANGLPDTGVVRKREWQMLMAEATSEICVAGEQDRQLQGRVIIVVDVSVRRLTVYEDGKEIVSYPVAVGKSSTPSPLGEWRIVQKSINWGNGFGTRWMGLNVPWGVYGIHGTNKPYSIGSYASHGCIRMFNRDAEKLYPLIPWGTTVRIVDNGKMYPDKVKPIQIKKGNTGQQVVYIQSRLKDMGFVFDRADGRYGRMTEFAVKYFQVCNGLNATGIVDEETYKKMGLID